MSRMKASLTVCKWQGISAQQLVTYLNLHSHPQVRRSAL
jgi:hypothetical protein